MKIRSLYSFLLLHRGRSSAANRSGRPKHVNRFNSGDVQKLVNFGYCRNLEHGVRRHSVKCILFILMTLRIFIWSSSNTLPTVEVPVDIHLPILLNVLTFDRNFQHRVDNVVVIGILYQEKFRESLNVKKQIEHTLKMSGKSLLPGVEITIVPINLEDVGTLKSKLENTKINVIYISPVRAIYIKDIGRITRAMKIISLTGVPEYCNEGISVGIGAKGGSSQIIVNLIAANAEGIDFSSKLLKLAKIIGISDRK